MPRPPPPRSTGKRLTDDERSSEVAQDAGKVAATNRVESGGGANRPIPVSRSDKKRRPERSPLFRLVTLLAETYRQPNKRAVRCQSGCCAINARTTVTSVQR